MESTDDPTSDDESQLSTEHLRLLAICGVEDGSPWESTKRMAFRTKAPEPAVLESFQAMYLDTLKEAVMGRILDNINELCCRKNEDFFRALKGSKTVSLDSPLLHTISEFRWGTDVAKRDYENDQLEELRNLLKTKETLRRQLSSKIAKTLYKLVAHFANIEPEKKLCEVIVDWFESGNMSLKQRNQWREINDSKNLSLETMKQTKWTDNKDVNLNKLQKVLKSINSRKFFEETTTNLHKILDHFLQKPVIEEERSKEGSTTVKIHARTVFLSEIITDDFEKNLGSKPVCIFAKDCVMVDKSLKQSVWHGINLAIVAKKITVTQKFTTIDVSGKGMKKKTFESKATNGGIGEDGTNGGDGEAGESSGNVTIIANQVDNWKWLTLKMNGGNGYNGQNGGDGGDGTDGFGVTGAEIKNLCVKYNSLYFTSWEHFKDYSPGQQWNLRESQFSEVDDYLWRKYEDADGRKITFSLAADKGWLYSTYDLYFLVKGSRGTIGGRGGRNGVGGGGGRAGELQAVTLSTGDMLPEIIPSSQKPGLDGANGQCGNPGISGKNGNDMVILDRSSKEPSRHIFPNDNQQSIIRAQYYTAKSLTRLDGNLKHAKKKKAHFAGFICQPVDVIHTSQVEGRTSSDRLSSHETVCKPTILKESLMHEYEELFKEKSIFEISLTGPIDWQAVKVDDDIEQEELVQEEISVVRTHVRTQRKQRQPQVITAAEFSIKLNQLVTSTDPVPIIEMITIWENFYKIPIVITSSINEKLEKLLNEFTYDYIDSCFGTTTRLSNGMSQSEVRLFSDNVRNKLPQKISLSTLVISPEQTTEATDHQEIKNNCIKDINICHNIHWKNTETTEETNRKLEMFMNDQQYFAANTELLLQLINIFNFLDKEKQTFENFTNGGLNWAKHEDVRAHFAKCIESEKTKNGKEQSGEMEEAATTTEFCSQRNLLNEPECHEASYLQKIKNTILRWGDQNMFPEIHQLGKEGKSLFEDFNEFGHENVALMNLFHLYEGEPPGSSALSIIHFYFLSQQFLNHNIRLFRYWTQYCAQVFIPADWYWDDSDTFPDNYNTFYEILKSDGMPLIDDGMVSFMQENGLGCSAYRHFYSDAHQLNLQVFCNNGFCSVRLVENINPHHKRYERIHLSFTGELGSINANKSFRQLKSDITSMSLKSLSCGGVVELKKWFPPSAAHKIEELTDAVKACNGSDVFLWFLEELFTLNGYVTDLNGFQFLINSIIDFCNNLDISVDQLCGLIGSRMEAIDDLGLELRFICVSKGRIKDWEIQKKRLHTIEGQRLRIMFASKLYEENFDYEENTYDALINMLSKSGDQIEHLETMSLTEWFDVAKCQKWNEFNDTLDQFGGLGYYLVQMKESDKMRAIIRQFVGSECHPIYLLERIISRVAFLLNSNEVILNQAYESKLMRVFQMINEEIHLRGINQICAATEENIVCKDNICLITNEQAQMNIIERLTDSEEMKIVLCQKDRSLEDLIVLTTEEEERKENSDMRKISLQEVKREILSMDSGTPRSKWSKWLLQIDDALDRNYGIRLRNTQKLAVLSTVIKGGNLLSQVYTGEGKSFIIASLAILRILGSERAETVDIITSSSVLAQRDVKLMQQLYSAFDINAAHNCDEVTEKRKMAYKCSVVYGDIATFERDYLLQTFYKKNILGSRTRCNAIVDEVDSMLLDNGSNMLYLSHTVAGLDLLEPLFIYLHTAVRTPSWKKVSGETDNNSTSTSIRESVLRDMCGLITKDDLEHLNLGGPFVTKVWEILIENQIIDENGIVSVCKKETFKKLYEDLTCIGPWIADRIFTMLNAIRNRERKINIPDYLRNVALRHLDEFIANAKKAVFLKSEVEYVVDMDHTSRKKDLNANVTIIDRGTGTDLNTSQWSGGLHQFLQLKHGCRLSPLNMKAVFISNVSYLKGYTKLNGFSGTLGSIEESNTLVSLYNTELLRIPTWKAKQFHEKVPIMITVREDWISKLFVNVCDQMSLGRSVLIVCHSISDVDELNREIYRLYKNMDETKKYSNISDCFGNVVVYRREFDKFDFSETCGLPCSRLVIATNLAGRGTDIKLTTKLVDAGGLHVIVSFLPENSRIEDQAYGRAARCGQPGSGQIIALIEERVGENNIFHLKQFRDNAEIHRIRSLKQYYEFHIDVEEKCLNLFRDHCSQQREQVYAGNVGKENLPTESQIFYFAFLDEWADWLDAHADVIRQCAKRCNKTEKAAILTEVKLFLSSHALSNIKDDQCDNSILKCPQPIITLSLKDISEGKMECAEQRLDYILEKFPEFAAEAYYYKGVIAQREIRQIKTAEDICFVTPEARELSVYNPSFYLQFAKKTVSTVLEKKAEKVLEQTVVDKRNTPEWVLSRSNEKLLQSRNFLQLARANFATRIIRKSEMAKLVDMWQISPTALFSRGYAEQQQEAMAVFEGIIHNIDDILGHTVDYDDFHLAGELPELSVRRLEEFVQSGIVSQTVLAKNISIQQLRILGKNHGLSVWSLEEAIEAIRVGDTREKNSQLYENSDSSGSYKCEPFNHLSIVHEILSMPSVIGFWHSMRRARCFLYEKSFLAVRKDNAKLVPMLECFPTTDLVNHPFHVHLSKKDLKEYFLYDIKIIGGTLADSVQNIKLHRLLTTGIVSIELVAMLDPRIRTKNIQLDQFDYITVENVMAEINVPRKSAEWILEKFRDDNVLGEMLVNVVMDQISSGDAGAGQTKLADAPTKTTTSSKKREETVYVLVGKPNCNGFPKNMRETLQRMMARQFCYGYALKKLKSDLGVIEYSTSPLTILLPTDPFGDLFADMLALGIMEPHRVTATLENVYTSVDNHISYIQPIIHDRLEKKKPSILLNTNELQPSYIYLKKKGVPDGGEMRRTVANGMLQLAVIRKPNPWKWAYSVFRKVASKVLIGSAAIFSPLFFLIETTVLAAVGTTLYVLAAFTANQKYFAEIEAADDDVEEFKVLRECHEVAVMESLQEEHSRTVEKVLNELSVEFVRTLTLSLQNFSHITDSTTAITDSQLKRIQEAFEHSEHFFVVQQGIQYWIRSETRRLQKIHMHPSPSTSTVSEKIRDTTIQITDPPPAIFAFVRLLLADVNAQLSAQKQEIETELDYNDYRQMQEHVFIKMVKSNTIGYVLHDEVFKLAYEILEDEIIATVKPAQQRLDSFLQAKPKGKTIDIEKELIDEKSMVYANEANACEEYDENLSADLHNIFIRACFKEIRPAVICHMIRYNYPLSAHCATTVFDAAALVLHGIGCDVSEFRVYLKREEQTIFTYELNCTDHGNTGVTLGLIKDCFYTSERAVNASLTRQHPSGLLQALCEHFPLFSGEFRRLPEEFIRMMTEKTKSEERILKEWNRKVKWHGHEKLVCSVAI